MRIALLALLLAARLSAASVAAPDLDTLLTQELSRLDRVLTGIDAKSLPAEAVPMLENDRALLARVRGATSPLVKVYRLRDAYVEIEALKFVFDHRSATDLERVRALAGERRADFAKRLPAMLGAALQLALRQSSANRARELFEASVPYAKVSSPFAGLYYIGEAEGNRRFREFVESLRFATAPEPRPRISAVKAALAKLDGAALDVFAADPGGQSAVGISSRLKEAHQQAQSGDLEASALMLMEAQLLISTRKASAEPAPSAANPRTDTLAAMWRAVAGQDGGDKGRFINRDVLPLYGTLFINAPEMKTAARTVRVTLVRWPYT